MISWPHDMNEVTDIAVQNLAQFKACLVCASNNPLAAHKSITMERIDPHKLVFMNLQDMSATRYTATKEWKNMGFQQSPENITNQINRVEELLYFITLNDKVAFVPEFVKTNCVSKGLSFLDLDTQAPPMFTMAAGY